MQARATHKELDGATSHDQAAAECQLRVDPTSSVGLEGIGVDFPDDVGQPACRIARSEGGRLRQAK